MDKTPNTKSSFKVKKGEEIFNVYVRDSSEEEENDEEPTSQLESAFQVGLNGEKKRVAKYSRKDCQFRCNTQHPNGSSFVKALEPRE